MGKGIISVIGGYLIMAVLVVLGFGVISLVAPADVFGADGMQMPGAGWIIIILIMGFLAAVAGGFVTARFGKDAPFNAGSALIGLIILMGILTAFSTGNGQPIWYQILQTLLGAAGAWYGANIRKQA